jgi:hypothetical protein
VGGCADLVQEGRQSEKVLQPDRQIQAQRAALQALHEAPWRDGGEGFILTRMICNGAVRQVTVIPNPGLATAEAVYCMPNAGKLSVPISGLPPTGLKKVSGTFSSAGFLVFRMQCDQESLQMPDKQEVRGFCPMPTAPDLSNMMVVELLPGERLPDYRVAMEIANAEADERLGQHMLLSWYDRDRDFESRSIPASAIRKARCPDTWITVSTTGQDSRWILRKKVSGTINGVSDIIINSS